MRTGRATNSPSTGGAGSAGDLHPLAHDGDPRLGDMKAAGSVLLRVHPDARAFGDDDVLVEDRAPDDGVPADVTLSMRTLSLTVAQLCTSTFGDRTEFSTSAPDTTQPGETMEFTACPIRPCHPCTN